MSSREHRGNILYERFYRIGVGTVSRRDKLWVTVMFATRRNPGTTMKMPDC